MSTPFSDDILAKTGLTNAEYQRVEAIMGRAPNLLELNIFGVMWSEHCSYKTTRAHLSKLPTTGACVICGPGENAGVIDIGDNQAAIFKMESHNHPSYIEPFQGAATGVGGILRDVFTMGARPVALMNALRFGAPEHAKTRHLVRGVVSGIGFYGNCVGVPTVGGECNFHPAYNGNCLVNAMAVGIAEQDKIFYAAAAGVGNPVVYVGAKTGRDGIHGATMASAEFDDTIEEKRPTVQVGDPFTEKLLIEACLELMQTDAIIAIQDMGAAGLTCSTFEMADKGGLGIELNLDKVPMREQGMEPYEIMLSESQERMLMVLKPDREHVAYAIFQKWDLDVATIGRLTDTGRMVLTWHGENVADMPVAPISSEAPVYHRPYDIPKSATALGDVQHTTPVMDALVQLMGCPDLASRRWIWEQYDHQVMNDTVQIPGADAAIVRVHGTNKALAIATDCTPRYVAADPHRGGAQAVVETWRNITASGGTPLAITNCLNFGNPEKPHVMGQIVGALEGMGEACTALDYPIVSGNVSLYNETKGEGILPTPAIGGVGLLADASKHAGIALSAGQDIFLLGTAEGHLGCSLYLREVLGQEAGTPPAVDYAKEIAHGHFIRNHIQAGHIAACHDISDGGLLVALAEMCLAGRVGASISLPTADAATPQALAFGEDQGLYIVTTDQAQALEQAAQQAGLAFTKLGTAQGDNIQVAQHGAVPLQQLRDANEAFFTRLMGESRAA